jgi:hypothetical protein
MKGDKKLGFEKEESGFRDKKVRVCVFDDWIYIYIYIWWGGLVLQKII